MNVIEQGQGDEVVWTIGVILTPLAGADENAMARVEAELTDLQVNLLEVQGDLTRNGDARLV